ncbi:MAG: hypothetical protein ACREFL_05825 [Stellaceae bacterium]
MPTYRRHSAKNWNKIGTISPQALDGGCVYITPATWRAGAAPFCGAPVLPGSSYCARHAPLCGVDPASKRGEQIAAEQDAAAAVSLLRHLEAFAVLEPLEEEGGLDAWDLPCPIAGNAEEE